MMNDDSRITPIQQGSCWRELLLLVGVVVPFIFWGIGSISFLDPDEGMYGTIAREMATGGDWITPHFDGVRYLEKPPLQFWLSALTISAFGPSEWSVRLWSALPAFGAALLIWRLGAWIYGRQGGVLAAIVFVTSVGVFRYVRVAATDFLLVFSLTLAMYGFVKVLLSSRASAEVESGIRDHSPRFTGFLLFYLGIALGVLSKGLIGLVFPLLIVGLFLLLGNSKWKMSNNRWRIENGAGRGRGLFTILFSPLTSFYSLFANRYSLFGFLLFLAIVLPWHIVAALRNPGFFHFYIVDNQLLRFLNSRTFIEDDVPVTTVAFLLLAFVWFFPWSLFIPAALSQGLRKRHSEQPLGQHLCLLVGMWALAVIGFFSLSGSKLEHYIFPALPPLSLMVGGLWSNAFNHAEAIAGLRWNLLAAAIGCSAVGTALIMLSDRLTSQDLLAGLGHLNVYYRILQEQGASFPFASVSPFIRLLKGLGVVLVVGLPLSFILFHFSMPKASFVTILCVSGLIGALVFNLILLVEPYHSSRLVAGVLAARSEPNDLIVHEGSLEYSGGLPFYTGRRIYVLNGKQGDLDFGSRYPEARHLFLKDAEFARLWEDNGRIFLVMSFQVRKGVLEKLSIKNAFLIGEYGSRRLYANQQVANEE